MPIAKIEDVIEDIRQGKMVILMDDKNRENEGDLCMAAEKTTPEAINFMARFGRGLICLSLTENRVNQLGFCRPEPNDSRGRRGRCETRRLGCSGSHVSFEGAKRRSAGARGTNRRIGRLGPAGRVEACRGHL
jgi:hypothetical protein